MNICLDDLERPEVIALLQAHMDLMYEITPPDKVFALDLEGLRASNVSFWTIWDSEHLLGCGALREIDPHHGEIKSMHTAVSARGRGIGRRMLRHIMEEAHRRGYQRVSLETGSMPEFQPARSLYSAFGFRETGPFEGYELDPYSTFMTREVGCSDE